MLIDMTDQQFGNLTCIKYTGKIYHNKSAIWLCKCEKCGNFKEYARDVLLSGRVTSCGCTKKEQEKNNIQSNKAEFIDGTCVTMLKSDNLYSNNKSGHKGISFDKARNKWVAQICFKRINYNLGRFDNIFDAVAARKEAEKRLHENFVQWYEQEYKK